MSDSGIKDISIDTSVDTSKDKSKDKSTDISTDKKEVISNYYIGVLKNHINPSETSSSENSSSENSEIINIESNSDTLETSMEIQKDNTSGDLQSLCWSAAAIGGILSAYFSGSLLQTVSPKTVFTLTAFFPLLISAVSFLIDEKKQTFTPSVKEFSTIVTGQIGILKETLSNPKIYLPVLFIFCWQATPSPDSAMFYFYTNDLKFEPEFLGMELGLKLVLELMLGLMLGLVLGMRCVLYCFTFLIFFFYGE